MSEKGRSFCNSSFFSTFFSSSPCVGRDSAMKKQPPVVNQAPREKGVFFSFLLFNLFHKCSFSRRPSSFSLSLRLFSARPTVTSNPFPVQNLRPVRLLPHQYFYILNYFLYRIFEGANAFPARREKGPMQIFGQFSTSAAKKRLFFITFPFFPTPFPFATPFFLFLSLFRPFPLGNRFVPLALPPPPPPHPFLPPFRPRLRFGGICVAGTHRKRRRGIVLIPHIPYTYVLYTELLGD